MHRDKHRGALSELYACAWLLGHGYEVFRNVSQHGLIDLIAIKNGEILKIDVKTIPHFQIKVKLTESHSENGVVLLRVTYDGLCELTLNPEIRRKIPVQRACRACNAQFIPLKDKQRFCSKKCYRLAGGVANDA